MIQTHTGGCELAVARLYLALGHVYVQVGMQTAMTALTWLDIHMCMYTDVYLALSLHIHIYTYICISIYIYIYIHALACALLSPLSSKNQVAPAHVYAHFQPM